MDNSSYIIIRNITLSDYYDGYFDLMYQLTNYKYDVSYNEFQKYLNDNNRSNCQIVVAYLPKKSKIIGAGTIFKISKLHNNPIGQIEDLIIDKEYRGNSYGRQIIQRLVKIGYEDFGCYKIVLNTLEENVSFYDKCSFSKVGHQMKHKF